MIWLARPCKHKLLVGLFKGEVKVEVSLPKGLFDQTLLASFLPYDLELLV
jgi:hypothetical protein